MFGHVQLKIKEIKEQIDCLQTSAQLSDSYQLEVAMQKELDLLLKREEFLWRDKAKATWMLDGDANTNFFHITTINHRKQNLINRILNTDTTWSTDRTEIGMAFIAYFYNMFASCTPVFPNHLQGLNTTCISEETNQMLEAIPTPSEIRKSVFSIGNHKSPEPEGMSSTFYKTYWNIVSAATIHIVQQFFRTVKLPRAFNHTFLTLSNTDQLHYVM